MKRYAARVAAVVSLGLLSAAWGAPTINYQGRVTAGGMTFNGMGSFKFMLLNGNGSLWSNDGSAGPGEPVNALSVPVNNGLFNVELGENMQSIPPLVFHEFGLQLRTWFSTNGIAFEQLSPDVPIRPVDFAKLDTGAMIIVDGQGKGDFRTVQEALEVLATNFTYAAVGVMPGYHEVAAPLTFPTSRWGYAIFGLGDRNSVTLVNTNGPAALLGSVWLRNLTLEGDPAAVFAPEGEYGWADARGCAFRQHSTIAPTLRVEQPGTLTLFDCDILHQHGGPALLAASNGVVNARHCEFRGGAPGTEAVRLVNLTDQQFFESCLFAAWEQGANAVCADLGQGADCEFRNCEIRDAVALTNCAQRLRFVESRLQRGVAIQGGRPGIELRDSQVEGWGLEVPAFAAANCEGEFRFENSRVGGSSNGCVRLENARPFMTVRGSRLECGGAPALEVVISATGTWFSAEVRDSQLETYGQGPGEADAVRLDNAVTNGSSSAELRLFNTRIWSGLRDGLYCERGRVEAMGTQIGGARSGIRCLASEVNLGACSVDGQTDGVTCVDSRLGAEGSAIDGGRHGVLAQGTLDVSLSRSSLSGGDRGAPEGGDGLRAEGGGGESSVSLTASEVSGRSAVAGQGRGLYLALTNGGGFSTVLGSVLSGSGPGLECSAATILVSKSIVYSESSAAALLRSTNALASFSGCDLYGMTGDNTTPAVVLEPGKGGETPAPRIVQSSLLALTPAGSAPYVIGLSGGATTGNVQLVQSVLCTNLDPRVGIVPVSQTLINGNLIP
jgi:hypothetical protein